MASDIELGMGRELINYFSGFTGDWTEAWDSRGRRLEVKGHFVSGAAAILAVWKDVQLLINSRDNLSQTSGRGTSKQPGSWDRCSLVEP